jgi:predicted short-subunit dehydrogenase-like oxidoreductase (DUF2520 family)
MSRSRAFDRIGFVGAGRTATALATAMNAAGYRAAAVASRSGESATALARRIPGCSALPSSREVVELCDVVLLTVPDDAIAGVAAELPWREGQATVHCSGALSLEVLDGARRQGAMVGGLHPYQTFPAGLDATEWLPGSTFAIEAAGELARWLEELVLRLGCRAVTVAEENRPLYHAAAVMSCGFVATLLDTAGGLWEAMGFSREEAAQAILPLAAGTLHGIKAQGTRAAATGPITRGDSGTIRKHIEALAERMPESLPLYRQTALSMVGMVLKQGTITSEQARHMEDVLNAASALAIEPVSVVDKR